MELFPNATRGWLKFFALFAHLILSGGSFVTM